MNHVQVKAHEEYLHRVATAVLKWADFKEYTEEELWDLIMLDLMNIKEGII